MTGYEEIVELKRQLLWLKQHSLAIKKYGLTSQDYADMLTDQGGRCAVCDVMMPKPAVDHCHVNGHVRGLLCSSCNIGLGAFKDNPNALQSAISYLRGNAISRKWWVQQLL